MERLLDKAWSAVERERERERRQPSDQGSWRKLAVAAVCVSVCVPDSLQSAKQMLEFSVSSGATASRVVA